MKKQGTAQRKNGTNQLSLSSVQCRKMIKNMHRHLRLSIEGCLNDVFLFILVYFLCLGTPYSLAVIRAGVMRHTATFCTAGLPYFTG